MAAPSPMKPSKYYRFEGEGVKPHVACRYVREFHLVLAAAASGGRGPDRLTLGVPSIPMDDFLAAWAEDADRAIRTLTVTRPYDGRALSIRASLLSYGAGSETALRIVELLAAGQSAASPAAEPEPDAQPAFTFEASDAPKGEPLVAATVLGFDRVLKNVGRRVDGDGLTLKIAKMNDALVTWVSAWAEDAVRPHRSVTIKAEDGRAVRVVALVASLGARSGRVDLRVEKVAPVS